MTQGVINYSAVLKQIGTGRRFLLIGNGFSVACDPVFAYSSLYRRALDEGLSPQAQALFEYVGTSNFEAVLRLLCDCDQVLHVYGGSADTRASVSKDLEIVKQALAKAVAQSHPDNVSRIDPNRLSAAVDFFSGYQTIFSLNYDLLPHWINMATGEIPKYQDGFRSDPEDPGGPTLLFCEPPGKNPGILFVHGALHIHRTREGVRKFSWKREERPLKQLILAGLQKNEFPVFVAEGTHDSKLRQIRSNPYLMYCFGKLGRIQNPLVTFGWSFGESDRHIVDTIADNEKLESIYVGVFGDLKSSDNQALASNLEYLLSRRRERHRKRPSELVIQMFDASTASPWGRG